jgi:hypothetical protein
LILKHPGAQITDDEDSITPVRSTGK